MARDRVARPRRRFLQASLAAAGAGLLSGCGLPPGWTSPARTPRIGVLALLEIKPFYEALQLGLRELGYVDDRTIHLEYRFAQGQESRVPSLAAELIDLPVDVIVAGDAVAARIAAQAAPGVPVVMAVGDPVESGLARSPAHPGGNVTGLSNFSGVLAGKRLELLRQVAPDASGLGVLWNPTDATKAAEWRQVQRAAPSLGWQLLSLEVRGPQDFASVFEAAAQAGDEALLVLGDPLTTGHLREIADFALATRLPSLQNNAAFAQAGGLMAYGPNSPELFRRAATYVDKILRGAKPADLPIEQPTVFDYVVNLETARALGLTIPPSVLQQATEIIQ